MLIPTVELRTWRDEIYASGNRVKAGKINRVMDRMNERRTNFFKDNPYACDYQTCMTCEPQTEPPIGGSSVMKPTPPPTRLYRDGSRTR